MDKNFFINKENYKPSQVHHENKKHWEDIYATKKSDEMSWTQEKPETSLNFFYSLNLPKNSSIIDIGGGDSKLVDYLINDKYQDITVLDISEHALKRTKERLGKKAEKIKWIVSDITQFNPDRHYDLWHDRATFHFLTTREQINKYLFVAQNAIKEKGFLILGTFSIHGPQKCSGLEIKQYSEELLQKELKKGFEKIRCITENHITPFNTIQNFLFCSFKRLISMN
ncbi:MAG: class I SAM-dependent methyltransferase [Desulfobacterales bacterium]|nr:class I SAM-dependent methyltransferase [Desulfobacterales bacterium]